MFRYRPLYEQVRDAEKENTKLKDKLDKAQADLAYVAMMTDVDIMDDSEEVEDNE